MDFRSLAFLLINPVHRIPLFPAVIGRYSPGLSATFAEIELFNPAYGLVKVNNRQELIVKHILDSLAPVGILKHTGGWYVLRMGTNGPEKGAILRVGYPQNC